MKTATDVETNQLQALFLDKKWVEKFVFLSRGETPLNSRLVGYRLISAMCCSGCCTAE
jgi:hypothetical protein